VTNAQTLFLVLSLQWASYLGVWLLCIYGDRRALEPKP